MATGVIYTDSVYEEYAELRFITTYTVNTDSADTYKVTATFSTQAKSTLDGGYSTPTHARSTGTGTATISVGSSKVTATIPQFSATALTTSWKTLATSNSVSLTVSKTHATQTMAFRISGGGGTVELYNSNLTCTAFPYGWGGWDNTTQFTLSIGARTSYAVSYNANKPSSASGSVSNVPSAQTKWHGEALTLSSTQPTLAKYTFTKWNTVAGGTGTSYNAGGSYTGNAALSLHAQWTYNHTAPKINTMVVKRCLQNGTDDDEGTYCKVEATYTIDTATESSAKIVSYTVKVGSYTAVTTTVSNGTASGSISYVYTANTVSTESPYNVTLTVTDNIGFSTERSSTLSPAFFTMDFGRSGHSVGIGKPASGTDDKLGIGLATDFDSNVTVGGTFVAQNNASVSGTLTANALTVSGTSVRSTGILTSGTLGIARGGTGKSSFTTYQPICGGTSTTGALQSMSSTSTGAMYRTSTTALPVWGTLPVAQGGTAKTSGAFHSATELYNASSGSNGTITLSAAVSGFDYLAVWTIDNNSKNPQISWIATRKANTTSTVFHVEASASTSFILRRVLYTISGTSMTPSYGNYMAHTAPSSFSAGTAGTNYIKVTRVMGYVI